MNKFIFLIFGFSITALGALPKNLSEFYDTHKLYYIYADIPWGAEGFRAGMTDQFRKFERTRLQIFLEDPNSGEPCPDPSKMKHTQIYESDTFEMGRKGNTSLWDPKPNIKIKLEDKLLGSSKRLSLNAMNRDISQMREALAFDLFHYMGVPAPGHTYARLCIRNGEGQRHYIGLYSIVENTDKAFLKRVFDKASKGNLYKANFEEGADLVGEEHGATLRFRDDQKYFRPGAKKRLYELSTNEDDPDLNSYEDFKAFIRAVNCRDSKAQKISDEQCAKEMKRYFDVDKFLRWAAVNTLIGAWDNYWDTPGNYLLYNSGRDGKIMDEPYFHWIPWDYDHSWGVTWSHHQIHEASIFGWAKSDKLPVVKNTLRISEFRNAYIGHVKRLMKERFNEGWISKRVREISNHIDASVYAEAFEPHGAPHTLRPFTNHLIWWFGWNDNYYWRGKAGEPRPHVGWEELRSYGLVDFVRKRRAKVQSEIH